MHIQYYYVKKLIKLKIHHCHSILFSIVSMRLFRTVALALALATAQRASAQLFCTGSGWIQARGDYGEGCHAIELNKAFQLEGQSRLTCGGLKVCALTCNSCNITCWVRTSWCGLRKMLPTVAFFLHL